MKNSIMRRLSLSLVLGAMSFCAIGSGMRPETPLVFINAAEAGGKINVKNTDAGPRLLYTTVQEVEGGSRDVQVVPTQPIARVEAGNTQQVRFVLTGADSLKVQQLKRVIFEGIPERTPGANQLIFTVRQDVPLIIHPKGLPDVSNPWTRLTWNVKGGSLVVSNDTPYVVRLEPRVVLLPSNVEGSLGKSFILPGEALTATFKNSGKLAESTEVKLFPATRYGYQAPDYVAQIAK